MKYYRYKQVQRMTFFGYDDLLLNDNSSLSTTSPQTVAVDAVTGFRVTDTKTLRFNINKLSSIQLSQNAKIVLESIYMPLGAARTGPATVRMNNLNTNSHDSQNNGFNTSLVYTTENTAQIFYNTFPEILYNFSIDQHFFKNGYVELQLTYPENTVVLDYFERFYISFVVYDVDEQDLILKDTPEVDFKNYGAHFNINNGRIPK
jgi:hypothetical protein